MSMGYIPLDRLEYIPKKHRREHELCFYIHDQMVALLKAAADQSIDTVKFDLSPEEVDEVNNCEHIFDFLQAHGRKDLMTRIVANRTSIVLYADMLHFIHDALIALEKRKYAVAFTLLRKPLKQNMLFASWLLADENTFYESIESEPHVHMEDRKLSLERRREIFDRCIALTETSDFFASDLLNSLVFDKSSEVGFAVLFDKAAHLITSRGSLLRTEPLNINFIFKSPADTDFYRFTYRYLSYLLMYCLTVQTKLYGRMQPLDPLYVEHVWLVTLGAYCSLYVPKKSPLNESFNRDLKAFLVCPYCRKQIRLNKANSTAFFLVETLVCSSCGQAHHFPLEWVLRQAKARVASKKR